MHHHITLQDSPVLLLIFEFRLEHAKEDWTKGTKQILFMIASLYKTLDSIVLADSEIKKTRMS